MEKPSEPKKRDILSVELSPEAQENLGLAVARLRMKKKDVVASVLAWFIAQEDAVQQLIVRTLPERFVGEVERELKESLAEAGSVGTPGHRIHYKKTRLAAKRSKPGQPPAQ